MNIHKFATYSSVLCISFLKFFNHVKMNSHKGDDTAYAEKSK